MEHTYCQKKHSDPVTQKSERVSTPSPDALRIGAAVPSQELLGSRVDLPDAIRSKMENAFGADLSAVRLYESEAVADAGANAITQGNRIAFAPGMLDFSSYGGQALLGHEISHVVSQARGEVRGGGFLNDHALEARADREGAMAASGQTVAMPTAALSSASAAPAAGPMQANKADKKAQEDASNVKLDNLLRLTRGMQSQARMSPEDDDYMFNSIDNLTDKELDMIAKRRIAAQKKQYDLYQSLSGSDEERAIRANGSQAAWDAEMYTTMLATFAMQNESTSARSRAAGKRASRFMAPWNKRKLDAVERMNKTATLSTNPLKDEIMNERIEKNKNNYYYGDEIDDD